MTLLPFSRDIYYLFTIRRALIDFAFCLFVLFLVFLTRFTLVSPLSWYIYVRPVTSIIDQPGNPHLYIGVYTIVASIRYSLVHRF